VNAHIARCDHRYALARILLGVLGCQANAEDVHRRLRLRNGDAVPETGLHEESRLARTPVAMEGDVKIEEGGSA
jgi:hypothetical protein